MSETSNKLVDSYNRRLNYLRISVTDRCNLRCLYCIPLKGAPKLNHDDILRYEEILRLTKIAVGLGVTKIRLTGGEPLVRKGIYEFIPQIASLKGISDISLTTNGIYLKKNLEKIKSGGITRINISLDTLQPEKFKRITGFDSFHDVWESLEVAKDLGFYPIKVNVVMIRGLNDDELVEFAKVSQEYPFHIRFIEYMPISVTHLGRNLEYLPTALTKAKLEEIGRLIPIDKDKNDGPCERFKFQDANGEIGFISAVSKHFCGTCNRLRLTASGHLRPCLLSEQEVDLKGPMRLGASDSELARLFLETTLKKPSTHRLSDEIPSHPVGQMSSIGG